MAKEVSDEFSALLTASQPRIYGFIFKRVVNHDLAKEILQDTNLVICKKADDYQPGTNFIAWVFRIAHFQILSQRQKANSRPMLSDQTIELLSDTKEENIFDDKLSALNTCLQDLSTDNRQLIMKRYSGKFSVQQYAQESGKRENAVSKILHKIRHSLSKCIKLKLAEA